MRHRVLGRGEPQRHARPGQRPDRLREAVTRRRPKFVTVALTVLVLGGGPTVLAGAAGAAATMTGARITRWVDGDTVETTRGTVRLIGIDTPERGRCGYAAATRHAQAVAPVGSRIQLGNPTSVVDHDRYGRILRYVVTTAGRDVGLAQIKDGARARYDSRDGYQWHPREASYHRADAAHSAYGCSTGTSTSTGDSTGGTPGGCAPGYSPCIPPYPPDLDCADVNGPIYVTGSDPHGLDADGDGVGCES